MKSWHVVFCAACVFAAAGSAGAGMLPGEQFHWNFRVDVTSGPLEGNSYFGDFAYTLTDPIGVGGLPPSPTLDFLNFNFVDQSFTEQDDVDFPEFPRARFAGPDNTFSGIDYFVAFIFPERGTANAGFTILDALFSYDLNFSDFSPELGQDPTFGSGTVTYELIPAPGAALLLGVSAWFGLRRRRD